MFNHFRSFLFATTIKEPGTWKERTSRAERRGHRFTKKKNQMHTLWIGLSIDSEKRRESQIELKAYIELELKFTIQIDDQCDKLTVPVDFNYRTFPLSSRIEFVILIKRTAAKTLLIVHASCLSFRWSSGKHLLHSWPFLIRNFPYFWVKCIFLLSLTSI